VQTYIESRFFQLLIVENPIVENPIVVNHIVETANIATSIRELLFKNSLGFYVLLGKVDLCLTQFVRF